MHYKTCSFVYIMYMGILESNGLCLPRHVISTITISSNRDSCFPLICPLLNDRLKRKMFYPLLLIALLPLQEGRVYTAKTKDRCIGNCEHREPQS